MIEMKDVLARVNTLPTLPSLVMELMRLSKDETASAADFEKLIRTDPPLTANLLRVTNSSYFGLRHQVNSVQQAVALLGTKRVCETAAGAAFASVLPANFVGYGMAAGEFWQHSAAVAIFCERIAQTLKLPIPDLMFTAGLLHDIGKLVTSLFLQEGCPIAQEEVWSGSLSYLQAEQQALGLNHAAVGAAVAEKWGLPPGVVAAAKHHHDPPSDLEPGLQHLVDLVHVSNGLSHMVGFGGDQGGTSRRIVPEAIARLGLTAEHVEATTSASLDEISVLGEVYQQTTMEPVPISGPLSRRPMSSGAPVSSRYPQSSRGSSSLRSPPSSGPPVSLRMPTAPKDPKPNR